MTISHLSLSSFIYLSAGAIFGSLFRFFIYEWVRLHYEKVLWATVTVNLLGSFIIGCLWVVFQYYNAPKLSLFFIPGLLGAFTTFSALSLDAVKLIESGQFLLCCIIISSQVILGISFCYLGVKIASKILPISL